MFLDSSADEDCEGIKDPIKDIDTSCDTIIDVPEYAAEIHQYLKIAEVNMVTYQHCSLFREINFSSKTLP